MPRSEAGRYLGSDVRQVPWLHHRVAVPWLPPTYKRHEAARAGPRRGDTGEAAHVPPRTRLWPILTGRLRAGGWAGPRSVGSHVADLWRLVGTDPPRPPSVGMCCEDAAGASRAPDPPERCPWWQSQDGTWWTSHTPREPGESVHLAHTLFSAGTHNVI